MKKIITALALLITAISLTACETADTSVTVDNVNKSNSSLSADQTTSDKPVTTVVTSTETSGTTTAPVGTDVTNPVITSDVKVTTSNSKESNANAKVTTSDEKASTKKSKVTTPNKDTSSNKVTTPKKTTIKKTTTKKKVTNAPKITTKKKTTTKKTTTKKPTTNKPTSNKNLVDKAFINQLVKDMQKYSDSKVKSRILAEIEEYKDVLPDGYDWDMYLEEAYSITPSNSSWGTPLTITTSWTKEQAKKIMKSYTEDWYKEISDTHFVVYAVWCPNGTGINSYGQDSWEIYWLY